MVPPGLHPASLEVRDRGGSPATSGSGPGIHIYGFRKKMLEAANPFSCSMPLSRETPDFGLARRGSHGFLSQEHR